MEHYGGVLVEPYVHTPLLPELAARQAAVVLPAKGKAFLGRYNTAHVCRREFAPVIGCPAVGEHYEVKVAVALLVLGVEVLPGIGDVTLELGAQQLVGVEVVAPGRCLHSGLVHDCHGVVAVRVQRLAVFALHGEGHSLVRLQLELVRCIAVGSNAQLHCLAVTGLKAVVTHEEEALGKRCLAAEHHGTAHALGQGVRRQFYGSGAVS